MSAVAVLAIHGIGAQQPGWSRRLHEGVDRAVEDRDGPAVLWQEVTWAEITDSRTRPMAARLAGHVTRSAIRELVWSHAGDALAYQRMCPADREDRLDIYGEAHAAITDGYWALREQLERHGWYRTPLVVIAHSLGTVLATDWLYDHRHDPTLDVAGLVTMGSPIPLWLPALLEQAPVTPPRWLNLFDPADPIGCPLRPVSAAYAAAVHRDVSVRNANWLQRLMPVKQYIHAHCDYDRNSAVHGAVADLLAEAALASAAAVLPVLRDVA